MKYLAFYSSDAQKLYRADIYRALALPNGYTIHFRYMKKYIHDDILDELSRLSGQRGIIYYLTGNNQDIPADERKVESFSIREVVVKKIYRDKKMPAIHFYLELWDFIDAIPISDTDDHRLAPNTFVSKFNVTKGENNTWLDRVTAIKDQFEHEFFVNLDSLKQNGKVLPPKFSSHENSSFYEIEEESEYQVELTYFAPSGTDFSLCVENTNENALVEIPSGYMLGALRDTEIFRLNTRSLNCRKSFGHSRLRGCKANQEEKSSIIDPYYVQIQWQINRGRNKTFYFGLFTMLAAIGLVLGQVSTKDLSNLPMTSGNLLLSALGVFFIGISAAALFDIFNKK